MVYDGTEQNSNYESFAGYYDLFYSPTKDIDFWLDVAQEMGSPILELGCGTGRLILPLAEAGYTVYGLDVSTKMLDTARKKQEKQPDISENVTLTLGDMRDFSLPCKFNLIIAAVSAWWELHTPEDRLKAAQSALNHLKEDGSLIIDKALYTKKDLQGYRFKILRHIGTIALESDQSLSCFEADTFDEKATTHNRKKIFFLDRVSASGQIERQVFQFVFSYIPPDQMLEELEQIGFREITMYGGYDRRPFDMSSESNERQIFVCKK